MRDLEAARYAVDRAFRQYDAADPTNRLVAAELELRWNRALAHVNEIEAKMVAHDAAAPPRPETAVLALDALRDNLKAVWSAPTTDARLKKRIVRTVIQRPPTLAMVAAMSSTCNLPRQAVFLCMTQR
jgi:hypothetical protein